MATADDPILTTADVADLLKVGRGQVRDLIKTEGLPHIKLGRRLRFSREHVLEWLLARKRTIQPPVPSEPEPKRRGRPKKGVVPGEWNLRGIIRGVK